MPLIGLARRRRDDARFTARANRSAGAPSED